MVLPWFAFNSNVFLETLSSKDHFFRDDPDYKNLAEDPTSIKVLPANQEDYNNHLNKRNVSSRPYRCYDKIL